MKSFCLLLVLFIVGCSTDQLKEENTNSELAEVTGVDGVCLKCAASSFAGSEPEIFFDFANGKRVLICGGSDSLEGKQIFTDFVISECGRDSVLGFWSAVENYEVDFSHDTLMLKKIEALALGRNFELINFHWLTEFFYYKGNELQKKVRINPEVSYNQKKIEQTLVVFEKTNWHTQIGSSEVDAQEKMQLANRLMLAAVSGSEIAEEYFKDFEKRFQPDGHFAEWYDEMAEMIELAKNSREDI
ncbi:hypothetical protein [Rufibacter roseus]|uniref:DUF4369 domain-containing protein n=1 Tax=Rufibacter roseus TaxID=1567108 RepID=A0ABW2DJC8_9BACT|nr:hypothetical protein [Rufibacter roseus]